MPLHVAQDAIDNTDVDRYRFEYLLSQGESEHLENLLRSCTTLPIARWSPAISRKGDLRVEIEAYGDFYDDGNYFEMPADDPAEARIVVSEFDDIQNKWIERRQGPYSIDAEVFADEAALLQSLREELADYIELEHSHISHDHERETAVDNFLDAQYQIQYIGPDNLHLSEIIERGLPMVHGEHMEIAHYAPRDHQRGDIRAVIQAYRSENAIGYELLLVVDSLIDATNRKWLTYSDKPLPDVAEDFGDYPGRDSCLANCRKSIRNILLNDPELEIDFVGRGQTQHIDTVIERLLESESRSR